MVYFDTWEEMWANLLHLMKKDGDPKYWVVPQVIGYNIQDEKPDPMDVSKGTIAYLFDKSMKQIDSVKSGLTDGKNR
ncbi:hypothetical protein [Aeromonas sp. MrichA-1]|uniref:hypothetical protein n=1 Tax=Aeromonas sp. MrichA-1 TaxID=2823362 RepID=UPI001B322584|nr:hypothetical protein [Aeromonas sp. MrichA-1]MBP4081374.1 hypothetical protein [Aeromonas sp. MrichA-1]